MAWRPSCESSLTASGLAWEVAYNASLVESLGITLIRLGLGLGWLALLLPTPLPMVMKG